MKIAIAGYGIEGEQNYEYFSRFADDITIVDEKNVPDRPLPENTKVILGKGTFGKLDNFDLVVRTAGLAPRKIQTNGRIWSATNEFFEKCPAPIIGVTGTKGKGTTCSLITSILRAGGKSVHLVGNIGTPALAELSKIQPDDIVVFELSSFQLWDAQRSPHVAVVLMIEPDHLDVHDSMEDYVSAKANIVRYQTENDIVIYNKNNSISSKIGQSSAAKKVEYPFVIDDFKESVKLPGAHNLENTSAAIAVAREFGVDDDAIRHGLAAFTGLPHRLKYVAEKRGVRYYDDSISTTPGSAIAAIKSFNGPIVLILGGHDKGGDYDELMRVCHDEQVTVIAIGENREAIAELCAEHGVEYGIEPGGMSSIVARAAMEAKSGVVVLSPAAASFDMFKNYADRGDQFITAVEQL